MDSIMYAVDEDHHWITYLDDLTEDTPSALPLSAATVVELAAVTARAQVEVLARRGQRLDWSDAGVRAAAARATQVVFTAVYGAAAPDPQAARLIRELVDRCIRVVWQAPMPVGRCRVFGEPLTVVGIHEDDDRDAVPGEVRCSGEGCWYAHEPLTTDPGLVARADREV